MTLNPDGSVQANDLYDITMLKPIDNFVDVNFGSFTSHVASGHTAIVNDIGGSTIDARFAGFVDQSNGTRHGKPPSSGPPRSCPDIAGWRLPHSTDGAA